MTPGRRLPLRYFVGEADGVVDLRGRGAGVGLHLFELLLSLLLINLGQLVRFEISNRYHVGLILLDARGAVLLCHFSCVRERGRVLGVFIECPSPGSVHSQLEVVAAG